MLLDHKLSYEHHLIFVGLLRKFQQIFPRQSLITIYKSFIQPHWDYDDIIYDRAFNESFHKNLESIQYDEAITITGAIRGTLIEVSSEKLFQELGLESLKSRRWLRELCSFYNIFHKKSLSYLFQLIPPNNNVYTKEVLKATKFRVLRPDTTFFKDCIFPVVISQWNSLDINIRSSSSINVFKK